MGLQNPRVALTVPKELNSVLEDISSLQGIPKTKVILGLLIEMEPQLSMLRDALQAAKDGQNPNKILSSMLSDALLRLGDTLKVDKL